MYDLPSLYLKVFELFGADKVMRLRVAVNLGVLAVGKGSVEPVGLPEGVAVGTLAVVPGQGYYM